MIASKGFGNVPREIPGIESVSLNSLKRYLVAARWKRQALPRGMELFVFPHDEDIEVVLPEASSAKDTMTRIADAITTLSAVESRSFAEVIVSIRSISYDLIRSRLPNAAIRHDTIRLEVATNFLQKMTHLLAALAQSEILRGPYFQRASSRALEYAHDCRFGHTYRGSFGFTVESYVGPRTVDVDEPFGSLPLERRAIVRLARGLKHVEAAIAEQDPNVIASNYDYGLNANACDDLADMIDVAKVSEIDFDISFSPEWKNPDDITSIVSAKIRESSSLEVLRSAAKLLKASEYEKNQTVIGKIRTLHSMKEIPAELFSVSRLQDVAIEWESLQFGHRLVKVSLGPADYIHAVQAHTAGQKVSVSGELERHPWRLENARDFKILG